MELNFKELFMEQDLLIRVHSLLFLLHLVSSVEKYSGHSHFYPLGGSPGMTSEVTLPQNLPQIELHHANQPVVIYWQKGTEHNVQCVNG